MTMTLGGEWSPLPRQNSGSSSSECEVADATATALAAESPTAVLASPGSRGRAEAAKQAKVLQALFSGPPRRGRRFKGVRHRKWGKFVCEVRDAIGKRIWLGSYDSEEQAARVYDAAARILQGHCAYLNFPQEQDAAQLPRATVKQLLQHRENVVHRLQAGSLFSSQSRQGPASPSSSPLTQVTASMSCDASTCHSPLMDNPLTWERPLQHLQSRSLETQLALVEAKPAGQSPAPSCPVAEEAGDWILEELLGKPGSVTGSEGDDFLPALQALASEMDQETTYLVPDATTEGASGMEEEQLITSCFGGWDPSSLWQHQGLGTVRVVELAQ